MKTAAVFTLCVLLFPAALAAQSPGRAGSPGPVQGSAAPQAPSPLAEEPEAAPEAAALSLYDLLEAAEGAFLVWRPDWPEDLPPDLFYVDESAGSALLVKAEWPDGGLECVVQDGRFAAFPVLMGGVLFQGRAEYGRDGRPQKLSWTNGGDEASDAEALEWDGQGRPVLFRVFAGDYVFAALEYTGRRVIETWYDRDGAALYGLIHENGLRTLYPAAVPAETAGPSANTAAPPRAAPESAVTETAAPAPVETRYFYTNEGRLSGIEGPGGTASALYNIRGMPRYLERSGDPAGPGTAPPDTAASAAPAAYTWQWDEAGRLVRLSGGQADNPLDYRYEYTLDSRGNWTERREFALSPLGPAGEGAPLVPRTVRVFRRTIRYESPAVPAAPAPGTEKQPPEQAE